MGSLAYSTVSIPTVGCVITLAACNDAGGRRNDTVLSKTSSTEPTDFSYFGWTCPARIPNHLPTCREASLGVRGNHCQPRARHYVMTVMTSCHYRNELIFPRLGCPGGMAHPNSIPRISRAQLCRVPSPGASTMTVHCTNIRHSKCHYSRTCNDAGLQA